MKRYRDLWEGRPICDCKAKTLMKRRVFTFGGFKVRGWHCEKCGESILHPEDTQYVLVLNKLKRGIPVKIGELGNSLILRIPKEIADFYKIRKGVNLVIKGKEKRMEIEL